MKGKTWKRQVHLACWCLLQAELYLRQLDEIAGETEALQRSYGKNDMLSMRLASALHKPLEKDPTNAITWTCIRKFYKSIGRLRWSKQQWRQKAKWKQNLILDINFWLLAVVFFVRSVIWWCVCFFDCFLFIPKALVAPVRLSFCRTDILQQGRDAECNQRKRRNLMTDTGDHCWCFKVAKGVWANRLHCKQRLDVVMGFEELHFKLDW